MLLSDLFTRLARGELSNLSMSCDGVLNQSKYATIVDYANEGLLRLHTRFNLMERDLMLELVEGVTSYRLDKQHALSNDDGTGDPYIVDYGDTFRDDMIRVSRVYNAYGIELPLNDESDINSLFTPLPKVIQVPSPVSVQVLDVVYQARHPLLTVDNLDAEIDLPDVLESALLCYIAFKVLNAMGTQESIGNAMTRQAQYEALCQEVTDYDTVGSSISTSNTKFDKRGWV